jgi:predicted GNAT family N-acyltransferase
MTFVQIPHHSELYQQEIALRYELLRAPLGLTFSEQELQAETDELHFGILASDQRLLACAVIVPLSPTTVKLRQMAVAAAHQRTGVGSRLVQSIEAELIQRGIEEIQLHARDVAVGFYQHLGYRQQGEPFVEVSLPHRKMTKSIA